MMVPKFKILVILWRRERTVIRKRPERNYGIQAMFYFLTFMGGIELFALG